MRAVGVAAQTNARLGTDEEEEAIGCLECLECKIRTSLLGNVVRCGLQRPGNPAFIGLGLRLIVRDGPGKSGDFCNKSGYEIGGRRGALALSDARIRNAKGRATRYRLSDSHGLSIEITPAGNKYWRYRYRIDGRENLFAAGEWCQAPAGETAAQAEARREGGWLTLTEARGRSVRSC